MPLSLSRTHTHARARTLFLSDGGRLLRAEVCGGGREQVEQEGGGQRQQQAVVAAVVRGHRVARPPRSSVNCWVGCVPGPGRMGRGSNRIDPIDSMPVYFEEGGMGAGGSFK